MIGKIGNSRMKKLLLILLCLPMIGFAQCVSGDCEDGQGTYIYNNGDKYIGEFKKNKKNGLGIYTWASTDYKIAGIWKKNKMYSPTKGFYYEKDKYLIDYNEIDVYKSLYMSASSKSMKKHYRERIIQPLSTELIIKLGWNKAVTIIENAIKNLTTLKDESINLGYLTAKEFELLFEQESNKQIYDIKNKYLTRNSPEIKLTTYGKIKVSVSNKILKWQQKGEFEKNSEYQERVNEQNRKIKIKEYQEIVLQELKDEFLKSIDFSNIQLGIYDSENETFLLKDKMLGDLVLSVPISEAKGFKENFNSLEKVRLEKGGKFIFIQNTDCVLIGNTFELSYFELTFGKYSATDTHIPSKVYIYNAYNAQDYAITDFDYEFSPIELDDITSAKKTKSSNISTNKLKVGTSSVNINIPTNKKVKNRYALIIGNEDYTSFQRTLSSEQNVDYAVNDATIFKKYCLNTLGVKEENMNFLTNATAGVMNQKINKMLKLMNKLGNEAELIVYYAGHGYPDELTQAPYLIPVDVSGTDLSYAIKLEDLYRDLGNTNAQVTVFLDACFTGGGRNSGLVASRGIKVKPKEGTLNGNIVVFSASSGDQSALPYHQQGHGMFTYHLLKKLQESKGKVSMGELADYIANEVSIQSININEKEQDPTVNTSSKVINDWRNWEFQNK